MIDTPKGNITTSMPGCNYQVSPALSDWILANRVGNEDILIVVPTYLRELVSKGQAVKRGNTYMLPDEN